MSGEEKMFKPSQQDIRKDPKTTEDDYTHLKRTSRFGGEPTDKDAEVPGHGFYERLNILQHRIENDKRFQNLLKKLGNS